VQTVPEALQQCPSGCGHGLGVHEPPADQVLPVVDSVVDDKGQG